MRWGRAKRTQDENSTEKKNFSLSDLLSFSWLSKFRSNSKTSPKFPSCKTKCDLEKPELDTKHYNSPPSSPCHTFTEQHIAPRRRSVGDDDRPAPTTHHKRHYSVGGDHVCSLSSTTLGNVIPFSVVPKQKQSVPPTPRLNRVMPEPGLPSHKIRRHRKLKHRLVIATSDESRRMSFDGKIRSRRYRRVGARSLRQRRKGLENFAVVKRSSEPERDFKRSMLEMIKEKGIRRPEELEMLLACYLSLNSDEHHHIIVKVFRQVCFEINIKQFGNRL